MIIENASKSLSAQDQFLLSLRRLKSDDSIDRYLLARIKSVFASYLLPKNTPVEIKSSEMITDVKEFKRCCSVVSMLLLWCSGDAACGFLDDYKQSFFALCASSQSEVSVAACRVLFSLLYGGWDYLHQFDCFHTFLADVPSLQQYFASEDIQSEKKLITHIIKTFYLPIIQLLDSQCRCIS